MGRLRVLSGSEVCKILEEHDFVVVRQHGSHNIMQKRTEGTTISVPVPLHDLVRRGTLLRHPAIRTRQESLRDPLI